MNLKFSVRVLSRTALLSAALVAMGSLAGCSTVKGWFGGKGKGSETKPAELVEFAPSASVTRLWSAKAGGGEGHLGARQGPAVADGRVYAAAVEGGVRAFDLQTGATVWTYASKLPLSGGPGAGDGIVAVGSLEGDVVALDAATGAEKWKAKVDNEVIAAPAIGQGLVVVHGNDGRVTAFLERCRTAGAEVLIGDPGRAHLPLTRLIPLAAYPVSDFGELKQGTVFAFDAVGGTS